MSTQNIKDKKIRNILFSVRAIVAQSNHLHTQVSTKFEQKQETESRIVSRVLSIDLFDQTTGEEILEPDHPVEIVFDTMKVWYL